MLTQPLQPSVLFLMPSVVPMQSIAGMHSGFFTHLSGLGFATQTANVPAAASNLGAVLRGRRPPDIVHAMTPLPPNAARDIGRHFPNARISVSMDRPQETAKWRSALTAAQAAVLPHSSFLTALEGRRGLLPFKRALEGLHLAGALHFISPGIDLDAFDPEKDEHIISRFGHRRPTKETGWVPHPGIKAGNYGTLQLEFPVHSSRDAQNVAYVLPRRSRPEGGAGWQKLLERYVKERHWGRHFILGEELSQRSVQRFRRLNRDTAAFVNATDEKMFHMLIAGAGTAVFLSDDRSMDFADNEMIRGILTFMRYGAMPVVPRYVASRDIVEPNVLPEGTEQDTWLYPSGFGFFYAPSSYKQMKDGIGGAEMQDFRANIGHGIYSAAVPNAMTAAMKHGIDAEAAAYAGFFRELLSRP